MRRRFDVGVCVDGEVVKEPVHELEQRSEFEPQPEPQHSAAEAATLTLSANDFSALEDRILRAVEVVRRERQAARRLKNEQPAPNRNCAYRLR